MTSRIWEESCLLHPSKSPVCLPTISIETKTEIVEQTKVTGPWEQQKERLFSKESLGDYDGGHGMIFADYDGKLWLSLHSPNDGDVGSPRTLFIPIKEESNMLMWDFEKRG